MQLLAVRTHGLHETEVPDRDVKPAVDPGDKTVGAVVGAAAFD